MKKRMYTQRLGIIADAQFQAALDRFSLGRFIHAEPVPLGFFGQNIYVRSTTGEYVLRGLPHVWWQFPTEQFFTRLLHERTRVPVPWPYLLDYTSDIFGWSFVIMPRLSGLQLDDQKLTRQLETVERREIAQEIGENLARMQKVTWPIAGRYNPTTDTIDPFELVHELALPYAIESHAQLTDMVPTILSYNERVQASIRYHLARAQEHNAVLTPQKDILWVEELIAEAQEALDDAFEPCLVMEDYKEGNLAVIQQNGRWHVSGVFDLMSAHFGDGEADLARPIADYLDKDPQLAGELFSAYRGQRPLRPGFAKRFPLYMLLDRALLWEYFQRHRLCWWNAHWTFRDWVSQYISPDIIFEQL